MSELFDISGTKSMDKQYVSFDGYGEYDYVGRISDNQGVQGRVSAFSYQANEAKTFSIVQIGDVRCFYRLREWYASQNILKLVPKRVELTECYLFIVTAINKALCRYEGGYLSYPTLKSLSSDVLTLPVIAGAREPDFDFMRRYIKAQQKLVVANVARAYQDELDTYNKVVA